VFFSNRYLYVSPPKIAPNIGATQNSHNWLNASPCTNNACEVERAGLTDVLVIGIEIKWIKVNAKPIAIPANLPFAHLSVAPKMIIRKNAVSKNSVKNAAIML